MCPCSDADFYIMGVYVHHDWGIKRGCSLHVSKAPPLVGENTRAITAYIKPVLHLFKTSLLQPDDKTTPEQPGPAVEAQPQPEPKKKKTLATFFKLNVPAPPSHLKSEAVKIETEPTTYLLSPEADPDIDPLQWWRRH